MEFENLHIDSPKCTCPLENPYQLPGAPNTQFKEKCIDSCLIEISHYESLMPLALWEVSSLFPGDDTVLIYLKKGKKNLLDFIV